MATNTHDPAPQSSLSPSSSPSHSTSGGASGRLLSLRALPKSLPIRKRGRASSTLSDSDPDAEHAHYQRQSLEDRPQYANSDSRPQSQAANHSRNYSDPAPSISGSSLLAKSDYGWNHKSLSKRISWGWNQTFAGLSPTTLTEVTYQRAQPVQINIQRRQGPPFRRPSVASSSGSAETALSEATSSNSTVATSLSVNDRPFANFSHSRHNSDPPKSKEIYSPTSLPALEEVKEPKSPLLQIDSESGFDIQELIDDMGLARSLTKRLQRSDSSNSVAAAPPSIRKQRPQISLPIELISTTNDLARTAPDILNRAQDDSNPTSPSPETPELTDNSSIGSRSSSDSPTRGDFSLTEPNHLTQYFASADNKSPVIEVTTISNPSSAESSPIPTRFSTSSLPPSIPRRAASHSKREHVRLARVRSVRNSGGYYPSSHTESRHSSLDFQSPDQPHPFSKELAQLDEVQEDFNSMLVADEDEADELWLETAGYKRFTLSAYCEDLQELEASRFAE